MWRRMGQALGRLLDPFSHPLRGCFISLLTSSICGGWRKDFPLPLPRYPELQMLFWKDSRCSGATCFSWVANAACTTSLSVWHQQCHFEWTSFYSTRWLSGGLEMVTLTLCTRVPLLTLVCIQLHSQILYHLGLLFSWRPYCSGSHRTNYLALYRKLELVLILNLPRYLESWS